MLLEREIDSELIEELVDKKWLVRPTIKYKKTRGEEVLFIFSVSSSLHSFSSYFPLTSIRIRRALSTVRPRLRESHAEVSQHPADLSRLVRLSRLTASESVESSLIGWHEASGSTNRKTGARQVEGGQRERERRNRDGQEDDEEEEGEEDEEGSEEGDEGEEQADSRW